MYIKYMSDFVPYPDLDDPEFYKKIFLKKEFYRTLSTPEFLRQDINQACDPQQFNLQGYQEFLRNFVSTQTSYNGMLAFWGVGTGKTCAAIQVTEGFKEQVQRMGKKIYIISKKQIRPNFWKELYSMKRERGETVPGNKQCTGATYYIPPSEERDEAKRERKIKNKIRENYEFFGIQSFANYVDFEVKKDHDVGEFFANSVIVIDEAHGLTGENKLKLQSKRAKDSDKSGKRKISERGILAVLHEILSTAKAPVKLILLTATPMKDNETELVDLLNLLLINDKRPMVDRKRLFPADNQVDEAYLRELAKGYVSYVRGENPVTFPRIEEVKPAYLTDVIPDPQMYLPKPLFTESGELLTRADWIKYTNLIRCPMSYYQYSNYRRIVSKMGASEAKESKASKRKTESVDLLGRQASNIIFPVSPDPNEGQYGNAGFKNAFDEYVDPTPVVPVGRSRAGGKQLVKKKLIQYKYKDFNKGFLHIDRIGEYSKKLEVYLHNVIKSEGTIYTYSDFVDVGAKIIALMLEENGFTRYRPSTSSVNNNLLYKPEGERTYRCAICRQLKRPGDDHTRSSERYHEFKQATYVLFTGDESKFAREEIEIVNSDENQFGQLVKVVVGTRVSGEGIDYKRLREVHIIDPWHNNTRLYQVIGRAARQCSHKDLEEKKRTVVVFKYCSAPPQTALKYASVIDDIVKRGQIDNTVPNERRENGYPITYRDLFTETSDERVYRRIEDKDLFVKRIERILKTIAVDCALNKAVNVFPHDRDGTRECDYTDCQYTCSGGVEEIKDPQINTDTYTMYFSEPQINRAQKTIYEFFRNSFAIDLHNMIRLVKGVYPDIETVYIMEAIDRIVGRPPQKLPVKIVDRFNRTGHVVFAKPYYIFQPDDLDDDTAPLYYRSTPLTIKRKFINLDTLKAPRVGVPVIKAPAVQGPSVGDYKSGATATVAAGIGLVATRPTQTGEKKAPGVDIKQVIARFTAIRDPNQIYAGLDRLQPEVLEHLFEEIIHAPVSRGYSEGLRKTLIEYLVSHNLIFANIGIGAGGPTYQYYAHEINQNSRLYDVKEQVWTTVDPKNTEFVQLKAMSVKGVPTLPANPLHGYLKYNEKKGDYDFKLVDLNKENIKMTVPQITKKGVTRSVSRKTRVTGKVCRNFQVGELMTYANALGIAGATEKSGKDSLCHMIELRLREYDRVKHAGQRWFYSSREAVSQ